MRYHDTTSPSVIGWRRAHGAKEIDKATRNHCLWVADNLAAISAWRETLAASQRNEWSHPTTIRRRYEAAHRAAAAGAEGKALTPMEKLKQALRTLSEENARQAPLRREVRRAHPVRVRVQVARTQKRHCMPSAARAPRGVGEAKAHHDTPLALVAAPTPIST